MARRTADASALDINDIASPRFSRARRGYDTEEVDAFISRLARKTLELDGASRRHKARMDLLEGKVAAAQEAAYARVFRQVIEVMRTAEREAGRIRWEAKREAEAILTKAREQASLLELEARGRNGNRRKVAAPAAVGDDLSIDVELLWGRTEA